MNFENFGLIWNDLFTGIITFIFSMLKRYFPVRITYGKFNSGKGSAMLSNIKVCY